MVWLILAMLLCVALAAAVVAVVAIPARREGREVLTDRGEELVATVTSKTEKVSTVLAGTAEKVRRRDDTGAAGEDTEDDDAAGELVSGVTEHGRPVRRRT